MSEKAWLYENGKKVGDEPISAEKALNLPDPPSGVQREFKCPGAVAGKACTALMTPVAGYTAKTKGKDEQIKKIDYPPYFTAGQRRHIAFCPESEETTERTKTLLSGNIIDTDPGKIFDSLFTASNTTSHSGSKADGDGKEQAEDGEEEEDYDKRTKQKKNGAKNLNELYAVALNNDPEQVFASGLTVGDTACIYKTCQDYHAMKRKLDGQHLAAAHGGMKMDVVKTINSWWEGNKTASDYTWLMASSNDRYPVYFLLTFPYAKYDVKTKVMNDLMANKYSCFLIMCDWKDYGKVPEGKGEYRVAVGEISSPKQVVVLKQSEYEAPGQE